jgi:PAS domain S-box-containing protein
MKPALPRPQGQAAACGAGALPPGAEGVSFLGAFPSIGRAQEEPGRMVQEGAASEKPVQHRREAQFIMGVVRRWWGRGGAEPRQEVHPVRRLPLNKPGSEGPLPPALASKTLREQLLGIAGPLVTMGVILGLVGVWWRHVNILYLPVVLVLAVAFSAYAGGTQQGLVSAALAWVFLCFYLIADHRSGGSWLNNCLVWTVVLPGVALFTGYLHHRAQEQEYKPWKGNLAAFRMASESVMDLAVILLDRTGIVTTWNTGAERLFGWSTAEMVGQTLARCCDAESVLAGAAKNTLHAAATQGRFEGEIGCARKGGGRFRAKLAVIALHDEQGTVAGYTVSAQDVSERREAASTLLRRAHQQVAVAALSQAALGGTDLSVLLEHAVTFIMQTWAVDFCGLFELQPDGEHLVLRAGAGWEHGGAPRLQLEAGPGSMLGYVLSSSEPVIVKDLAAINRFRVPEFFQQHHVKGSLLVVIPGQPRPFGIIGVHTREPGEFSDDDLGFLNAVGGVLATSRARLQAEAARLQLEAQFRQSQKMEAIGQLAAGVAHDFNNILTILDGYASRLASREMQSAPREDALQILEATERAASLTRQLLAFSRRQTMQLRPLDLRSVVADMARMLERLIGEHIKLQVVVPERLPVVSADTGMMEQILLNLVVNARDAMPAGGHLRVEIKAADLDETAARQQSLARPGHFVCLQVTDTGCGMDAATRARIFEPFFTTKGPGRGTGLGLATVFGIVQQHQGWIEVQSEPKRGTTFSIFFPAGEGAAVPSRAARESAGPPRGGQETILMVEDEQLLRDLARATLEEFGYTVLPASTALEALVLWKQHRQSVDLVLTDMVMPGGLTGRDLCQQLRRDRPELRVIVSSGYGADVPGKEEAGAVPTAFLQKPYRPADLARAVRDCLDMSR